MESILGASMERWFRAGSANEREDRSRDPEELYTPIRSKDPIKYLE
jgi:hypothetical protein